MPFRGEVKNSKELGYRSNSNYIWRHCEICQNGQWIRLRHGAPISKRCRCCSRIGRPSWNWKGEFPPTFCLVCGKPTVKRRPCKAYKAMFCSRTCAGRYRTLHSEGIKHSTDGYIHIRLSPEDLFYPMASWGYALEHRYIMAKHLNRLLIDDETIHHINGIRDDNRIENLALVSRVNHPHRTIEKIHQRRIRELEQKVSELNKAWGIKEEWDGG